MTKITAQNRNKQAKAKALRREGFVPGTVCGKELPEGLPIQLEEKEAKRLLRSCKRGAQVTLTVGEQTFHTILKDYSYQAITKQIEFLDFQALAKGEKIHATVEVVLKNEEMAEGVVTQQLSEIHYTADAEHLLDTIVLDFEHLRGVKSMKVSDLPEFQSEEVVTAAADNVIFSVTHPAAAEEEETEEAAASEE